MVHRLCDLLINKKLSVATAESCTGGGVCSAMVAVSGISAVLKGGIVTYTDEMKHRLLGVDEQLLSTVGAVSEACAEAMAEGVRARTGAMFAVSTTGFAGPDGGTETCPVGTVYIGIATPQGTYAQRFCFAGSRKEVTAHAVEQALRLLLNEAEKY